MILALIIQKKNSIHTTGRYYVLSGKIISFKRKKTGYEG